MLIIKLDKIKEEEYMALKKLGMFQHFNFDEFAKGKRFMCIGTQIWKDFESGEPLGKKIEVVIVKDATDYGNKDGEIVNNLYEKLVVKTPMNIDIPANSEVRLINVEAVVYGEFRNMLSLVAESIEVVGK